ncbi:hypothetical protein T05_12211 [Trichinella murrelli]|uniref:Uncharacterized protein n=1 Tax=Trichinella murrelli TaxID=144512 RepID=A0A0V0TAG4_9BILA|nr:hypothetical protein T05_12211 [Trichinella murrelli]
MSPSNVGNFGIGLVELVLRLLFLVAGGWRSPAVRRLEVGWFGAYRLARRIPLLLGLFLPPASYLGNVAATRRRVASYVPMF